MHTNTASAAIIPLSSYGINFDKLVADLVIWRYSMQKNISFKMLNVDTHAKQITGALFFFLVYEPNLIEFDFIKFENTTK